MAPVAIRCRKTRRSVRLRTCNGWAARAGRAITTACRPISGMVSNNGRIFYIMDMGSRISIMLPPHWKLIARDGYNGMILWDQRHPDWQDHHVAAEERTHTAHAPHCGGG